MENKLQNIRTKDEKRSSQGGVSWWFFPRKMNFNRGKEKEFVTFTLLTLLFFTLLLWTYQGNPPLLPPKDDQYSHIPTSVASQKPKGVVFAHGETKDEQKSSIVSVENTKYAIEESSIFQESPAFEVSSVTQESSITKKENMKDNSTLSSDNKKVCNYANGRWVVDKGRPLYSGSKCKRWLSYMWACRITQRTDFGYEGYRWQPTNCDMPKFERSVFLERMQDKTIAFVGDSLGRQQLQSLMCMATGGEDDTEIQDVGHEYGVPAFRFVETNTTILYYWSSCLSDLVPLNASDPKTQVAMHLDRPPSFIKQNLHKFDVLVLNTGHHWNRGKVNANRWVLYADGKPRADRSLARAKNLTIFSITKWVDSQLPYHPRLKVFFRTISPRHFFNGEWNTGGTCESTTPLARGSEVKQEESSDQLAASAVRGTKVKLLDITGLSQLRDEGHISRYSIRANSGIHDCLHWCLPGIPDTWNEILAAQI